VSVLAQTSRGSSDLLRERVRRSTEQEFAEHPVEVARRASNEAADLVWEEGNRAWGGTFDAMASSLPDRRGIKPTAGPRTLADK